MAQISKPSLAYAKIVATPTDIGWSQAYNAGSLFAVLSLTTSGTEKINLPTIGKDLLSSLEAEFFTLEEKTLRSIETAMKKSFEKIIPGITTDACLAFFKNDLLYILILGKGKIIIKRGELLGLLLEKKTDDTQLLTASGQMRQGDIILLQTDHFAQNIEGKNITSAFELQLPNDIAESLSPHVHKKEDGSQAAIIIAYNGAAQTANIIEENIQPINEPILAGKSNSPLVSKKTLSLPSFVFFNKFLKKLKLPIPSLAKKQIIAIGIGIPLIIILIASIIFTKAGQENAKNQALFQQIYSQARKNYDEGKEIAKLNQTLAQDDYSKAGKIIKENIQKFKTGSQQQIKLQALLKQIESELSPTASSVRKISPIIANADELDFLNIEKTNHAIAYSQDTASVYMLTDKAVTAIDKAAGKKKNVLLNDNDWSQAVALSPYQGNIYILDKKAGIIKFIAAADGFGKTGYFPTLPKDISKMQSMAIDGSIWILTLDGKILKFTKGVRDNFAIAGLDKSLKSPSKIFTDKDTDNLYILDKGNGRIIVLDKKGKYANQYNVDILRDAIDFEIIEKDQKALILSKNKIWEIPL